MKTLAFLLISALSLMAQSPNQHVSAGGLEVITAPYTNLPAYYPGSPFDESMRAYGVSVIIVNSDAAVVGYRIQMDVTFSDGSKAHVDSLRPTYWGCWYIEATGSKYAAASIANLVVTPVTALAPVVVPLKP